MFFLVSASAQKFSVTEMLESWADISKSEEAEH